MDYRPTMVRLGGTQVLVIAGLHIFLILNILCIPGRLLLLLLLRRTGVL